VEKMYPKRKAVNGAIVDVDDLCDESAITKRVEDGDLNPADAGILIGNMQGSVYTEEEEE